MTTSSSAMLTLTSRSTKPRCARWSCQLTRGSLDFQSLPGADRLAKRTGATIIGNGEAINVMRQAGVPETQLLPVSGGERVPLFTKAQRDEAVAADRAKPHPPGPRFPPVPNADSAVVDVHVWPALHCLLPPGGHDALPDTIDTGTVYTGSGGNPYACTIDITRGMTHGIGGMMGLAAQAPDQTPREMRSFLAYMNEREAHRYSFYDGGQLMYHFFLDKQGGAGPTMLWHGHLGCYEGIMKTVKPKPDVAVLAIAGRANLDGRPFDGSAAEFAVKEIQWLGEPDKVIWCLHDEGPLKPYRIDTTAATGLVHAKTTSKVFHLDHKQVYRLFE